MLSVEFPAQCVVVVGQGYVAYPLQCGRQKLDFRLIGFDLDQARSQSLSIGHSFVDDVPNARLQAALATGRYQATSDPQRARASTSP